MTQKKKKQAQEKNAFKENLKAIFYALIIAGVFRSFIAEPFHIPSGSMKDNLLVGDFVMVTKYSYGYSKYSFPFAAVPIKKRIWQANEPQRGDVIVFKYPTNTRINYIKRLIGVPGDKIQVIEGKLYLNEKLVPQTAEGVFTDTDGARLLRYREELPGGVNYIVLDEVSDSAKDNTGIYTVPEGYYFFMGDNRDNSQDSRFLEVGFVPEENLLGKASFIFMSSEASLLKFWTWHKNIRFSRILSKIN